MALNIFVVTQRKAKSHLSSDIEVFPSLALLLKGKMNSNDIEKMIEKVDVDNDG